MRRLVIASALALSATLLAGAPASADTLDVLTKNTLTLTDTRGEAQICMPLEADKGVGDSWEINGPTGRPVWTAAIVEGRETLDKAASPTAP